MELSRSVVAYKVFRNILLDEESYSVQLELKHGLDEKHSEQVILRASEEGFLDVVKDSDPRQYKVNFDKLADQWYDLWEEETGEVPVTPQNFDSFIKEYAKSYMENEEHSTIREMMVEEFYLGLNQEATETYLTNDFKELKERLGNRFTGKRPSKEYVKYGLNHR
jgi:hypothetical protein